MTPFRDLLFTISSVVLAVIVLVVAAVTQSAILAVSALVLLQLDAIRGLLFSHRR